MKNNFKIWITWHYSARSRNLASELNLPIYEIFIVRNVFLRHFLSSVWTIWMLITKRPKVIFLQLSFLLLLICAIYKVINLGNIIIVADCHTKALRRKANGVLNFIFWPLKKFSFKKVNLSIVSNDGMIPDIKKLHDNYLVLPDKIPDIEIVKELHKDEKYCVYISSFAVDEPIWEIFKVAELLNPDIKIYWTGKLVKEKIIGLIIPDNLIFTGYLSFEEYYKLIGNANCVLALTIEKDCLQSGAYEALSVEVPMVISDSKALREYFLDSAVYTAHDPHAIAKNIRYAVDNYEELRVKEVRIKKIRNQEFEEMIKELKEIIVT